MNKTINDVLSKPCDESLAMSPSLAPLHERDENAKDIDKFKESADEQNTTLNDSVLTPSKDYRSLYCEVKHKMHHCVEKLKFVSKENGELKSSLVERDEDLNNLKKEKDTLKKTLESKSTELESL